LKIVAISDTHCRLKEIEIPPGDVLIHAGDLTNSGNLRQFASEMVLLGSHASKFKKILYVPGNHDFIAQEQPALVEAICSDNGVTCLIDKVEIIENLVFYGSPWQPEFCNWAFNLPRGEELRKKWSSIPDNVDVLITHGPPAAIGDMCFNGDRVGCYDLLDRVGEITKSGHTIKAHIFGHIHYSYGVYAKGDSLSTASKSIMFINAATCGEDYLPTNPPITITI
jgi:Icc-related predicted phosphoesterase